MKKLVFAFLAIGVSLVFIWIVLETGLRMAGPSWLKQRMKEVAVANVTGVDDSAIFGSDADWPIERIDGEFYRFRPGSQFTVSHYEYSHIAHIDHLGGRRSAEVLPGDGMRIPFLGDSFTFGVGVADEETFVSRLNRESKTVLVNLGVPGSCLRDHLDILTQRHEELGRPQRYVFVFFIGNDLANLYVERTTKDEGSDNDLRPASRAGKILQAMNDFIRTNRLLRKVYSIQYVKSKMLIAYNRYRESKGVIRRMDDEYFHMVQMTPQFGEMLNYLDEELARLADLQRDLDFHSLFLIIPDRHQVSSELLRQKLKYYGLTEETIRPDLLNTELTRRLDDMGIPYIDGTPCLRKHQDEDLYYTLDNHLTARGHAVLQACIQQPLTQELQL